MVVKRKPILIAASEDFQIPDEGTYTDVEILEIEDLGLQKFNYKGKEKEVLTLNITFQLGDTEYSRFFSNSAHPKSNLYALYKAAEGKPPVAGMDVSEIVGKKVDITVSHIIEAGQTQVILAFTPCRSARKAAKPATKPAAQPAPPDDAEESDSDANEITDADFPFRT